MIKWKQRLYAFLLRRVVGPLLDSESQQKLHESIEVSLQEGTFTLSNVSLSTSYLNNSNIGDSIYIKKARVSSISIQLSLLEGQQSTNATQTSSSSLAWRAMNLGSKVSLVAHVDIDGIELEVEPLPKHSRETLSTSSCSGCSSTTSSLHQSESDGPDTETSSVTTVLSSYIEAALASLQLTFSVTNFSLRVGQPTDVNTVTWVELRMPSLSYQDMDSDEKLNTQYTQQKSYKTILEKTLIFQGITITTGETTTFASEQCMEASRLTSTIALAEGTGLVSLRAVDYGSVKGSMRPDSNPDRGKVQQDIEIRLNQHVKVSLDETSLLHLLTILNGFQSELDIELKSSQMETARSLSKVSGNVSLEPEEKNDSLVEEGELYTIDGILKQYQEARKLAERNEMRGGILVPSNAYEEGTNEDQEESRTFDVFFDANDKSFYNYTSIIQESVLAHTGGSISDFVRTKVRFHLLGGGLKLTFRSRVQDSESFLGPDEYILLTFDDVDISTAVSNKKTEFSFNISYLEIDNAESSIGVDTSGDRRLRIGSMLSFGQSDPRNDLECSEILLQPACISIQLDAETNSQGAKHCDLEMTIRPVELIYRHRTLSRLADLSSQMKTHFKKQTSTVTDDHQIGEDSIIGIRSAVISLSSLTLTLPVLEDRDFSLLYNRCARCVPSGNSTQSAIGLVFDQLRLEHKGLGVETSESQAESTTRLDCHSIVAYASSPEYQKHSMRGQDRRIDICAITGRFEVDPYIPISAEYRHTPKKETSDENIAAMAFPAVPAFSCFKARQEDEDEDEEIDRILSGNLNNVDVDGRRALRAQDPQSAMRREAEKCEKLVLLHIPDMAIDISKDELSTFMAMIQCIAPQQGAEPTVSPGPPNPPVPLPPSIAVSLACDVVKMSIHNKEHSLDKAQWNSYFLRLDQCRAFAGRKATRFLRFLSHEVTIYEVFDVVSPCPNVTNESRTVLDRAEELKKRVTRTPTTRAFPLFYRSKLLPAISQNSPSLLIDFIRPQTTGIADETEQSVFLSLYNMTHRYDPDSTWLESIMGLLESFGHKPSESRTEAKCSETQNAASSSLTRVFLSVADCNIDYMSPKRFQTPSRTILSVGDLRLSSNIINPAGLVQAFSVSLGDVSWYLCNTRFPYNIENSLLPGAPLIMAPHELSTKYPSKTRSKNALPTEVVFSDMGFKTVVTLDSMDAIIAKRNPDFHQCRKSTNARKSIDEPDLTISLTLGELSLYGCKDSFKCLVDTIGELQIRLTALSSEEVVQLRSTNQSPLANSKQEDIASLAVTPQSHVATVPVDTQASFLLDGYDWTTIDHDGYFAAEIPPGEEQSTRWYNDSLALSASKSPDSDSENGMPLQIINQHFPLHVVSDPLMGGDMQAPKFAGTRNVSCATRVLLHDMKFKCRCFDGYDWPEFQRRRKRDPKALFVIEEPDQSEDAGQHTEAGKTESKKDVLLGGLLDSVNDDTNTFGDVPLPEERIQSFLTQNEFRRCSRRTNTYVQAQASGVSLRLDSYSDSAEHYLKSCLDLALQDFFIAETVSNSAPIKMLGEWFNEIEHPRDSSDGLVMLKMVTWKPLCPTTPELTIANDESEVAVTLAPIRCIIDQRAVKFLKAFFNNDNDGGNPIAETWADGLQAFPPPLLRLFRVEPVKLKIDYSPQKIDTRALKNGSVVELINLSPLDSMVLTLNEVRIENVVGFGEAIGDLVSHWLGDVCATQMHKFLTHARPFEPLSSITAGVSDVFLLPLDAYKHGGSVSRALRTSVASLVGTIAHETLTTSSRMTGFVAGEMARATSNPQTLYGKSNSSLPSRPLQTPRRINDTASHALESLARGVQTANYKIVIVPYREYHRSGARGAVKSMVKGIPIAVVAPVSGASEALSYTLLGARNQIRPDIRKEEEVNQRGLHYGGI